MQACCGAGLLQQILMSASWLAHSIQRGGVRLPHACRTSALLPPGTACPPSRSMGDCCRVLIDAAPPLQCQLLRCPCSVQVIKVDHDFGTTFSGVLTDRCGCIRALWGSYAEQRGGEEVEFCAGMPTALWTPWLNKTVQKMNAAAAGTAAGQQQAGVQLGLQQAMHASKSMSACSAACVWCWDMLQRLQSSQASPNASQDGCAEQGASLSLQATPSPPETCRAGWTS